MPLIHGNPQPDYQALSYNQILFEKIKTMAVDIAEALGEHDEVAGETAFRYAAETWMQQNNMILLPSNPSTLPIHETTTSEGILQSDIAHWPGRGGLQRRVHSLPVGR